MVKRLLAVPLTLLWFLQQTVLLGLSQIWANKMRSLLTVLGIIIGVASITAVMAALRGMRSFVLSELESFGTNTMFILVDRPHEGRYARVDWWQLRFRPEQFEGWRAYCPSVAALSRVVDFPALMRDSDRTAQNVRVNAVDPSWHDIEGRPLLLGRGLSTTDEERALQVCLITPPVREELRLDRDCIGTSVFVNDRRFTIIGVIESRTNSAMFRGIFSEKEVFIPFSVGWRLTHGWIHATAASRSPDLSDEAMAELRVFMRRQRHLQPADQDTFQIQVLQHYLDRFRKVSQAVTMAAAAVVSISLVVGGIGIMNIMLVSVSERTREIGLRKAVGAQPGAIMMQFLVEAVLLCMVGGLLGLLLGQQVTQLLRRIPAFGLQAAQVSLTAAMSAIVFASAVGVVFGMYPAVKAARLDPIEALRHE